MCAQGRGGGPSCHASRRGCAVPGVWHHASSHCPLPGSSGTQAGLESLLHLPQPARGRSRVDAGTVPGGGLPRGGHPLTACPSWLLQVGGGARQAREPADHGGHAARGKRSQPGEAGSEPRGRRARLGAGSQHSLWAVSAQPLLCGAGGLSYLPCFGAGKASPARSCRKAWAQEPRCCLSHAGLDSGPSASERAGGLPAPGALCGRCEDGLWLFWLGGSVLWVLLHTGWRCTLGSRRDLLSSVLLSAKWAQAWQPRVKPWMALFNTEKSRLLIIRALFIYINK